MEGEEIMKKLCGREPEQEKSEQGVPVPAHACGECTSTGWPSGLAWLGGLVEPPITGKAVAAVAEEQAGLLAAIAALQLL